MPVIWLKYFIWFYHILLNLLLKCCLWQPRLCYLLALLGLIILCALQVYNFGFCYFCSTMFELNKIIPRFALDSLDPVFFFYRAHRVESRSLRSTLFFVYELIIVLTLWQFEEYFLYPLLILFGGVPWPGQLCVSRCLRSDGGNPRNFVHSSCVFHGNFKAQCDHWWWLSWYISACIVDNPFFTCDNFNRSVLLEDPHGAEPLVLSLHSLHVIPETSLLMEWDQFAATLWTDASESSESRFDRQCCWCWLTFLLSWAFSSTLTMTCGGPSIFLKATPHLRSFQRLTVMPLFWYTVSLQGLVGLVLSVLCTEAVLQELRPHAHRWSCFDQLKTEIQLVL